MLSTAVLFPVAGFVGGGLPGAVFVAPQDPLVAVFAQLAPLGVPFTEGMRLGRRELGPAAAGPRALHRHAGRPPVPPKGGAGPRAGGHRASPGDRTAA